MLTNCEQKVRDKHYEIVNKLLTKYEQSVNNTPGEIVNKPLIKCEQSINKNTLLNGEQTVNKLRIKCECINIH